MRWSGFEAAAGELGAGIRAVLQRHGFVLLGTVRRDGTPRISPGGLREPRRLRLDMGASRYRP